MEKMSNKLVIVLLVLIILSTVITTIGFMNIETKTVDVSNNQAGARASINIVSPEEQNTEDSATADASINIVNPS